MTANAALIVKEEKPSTLGQWKFPLWLQGLILFISSLLMTGYRINYGNQAITIPLVQSINNPVLFPNDPFVSTLVHYAAPIWRLVAVLANYIPIEILLTFLFLVARALVLIAAAQLAMTINPGSKLAAVGAMAFFALWPISLLGHGTLVSSYFEQTSLFISFFLFAIAAFYTKRPYYWALWLAVGFTLNSMYGAYACVYFAAVFLLDNNYRSAWKNWVWSFILFAILILPTVMLSASAFRIGTINNEIWLLASEARFPMHLYPLTWNPQEFYVFFGFMFMSATILYFNKRELSKLFKHGMIWLLVSLGWILVAFVAAYIMRSPTMLVLHPARATDLWFAFTGLSIIAIIAYLIELDTPYKKLYVILLFISILWQKVFDFTYLIVSMWLIITIAVLWRPFWRFVLKEGSPTRLSNIVVLIVLSFGVFFFSREADSIGIAHIIRIPDSQIQEIADWAKKNTSIGDVFLIDPNWSEFRALSQRPVFTTYKDGAAILWDRSFVEDWVPRMEALGYNFYEPQAIGISTSSFLIQALRTLYEDMDNESVTMLSHVYPVRFWITPINHTSPFPIVFQTLEYKVLDLKPPIEAK